MKDVSSYIREYESRMKFMQIEMFLNVNTENWNLSRMSNIVTRVLLRYFMYFLAYFLAFTFFIHLNVYKYPRV